MVYLSISQYAYSQAVNWEVALHVIEDNDSILTLYETPTLIIAGNIKTDPHPMNHDLDTFKINAIAIIASILK